MLLDTIHSREDLLAVPEQQLPALCEEIRQFLVQNVSRTGWCSTSATSATSIRC